MADKYTGPARNGLSGYYAHTQVDPYNDMDYGYGFDNGVDPYAIPSIKTINTDSLTPKIGSKEYVANQPYRNISNSYFSSQPQYGGVNKNEFGNMSNPMTSYKFDQMGLDTLPNNYQLNNAEMEGIQNSMAGLPDISQKQLSDFQEAKAYQSIIDKNNEFDWKGATNVGLGAANTLMNIGSYFDNKKMNEKRMDALNQNMDLAKQARKDRTNFLSGTKSAFA